MKETSVEWLEEELKANLKKVILEGDYELMESLFEQAKAMHKEEIMDAFQEGKWDGWENHKLKVEDKESQWTDPAHYYNETFNTKEK